MSAGDARRTATLGGIPMKHISLVTLTFQNSLLILIMHYSRIMPPVNGHRYYTSTAVLFNEIIKLAISLSMSFYEIFTGPRSAETSSVSGICRELGGAVFAGDSWKLAIPALLYTLQNSLQYVAVSNLDAATFQVTYQLKILTTALFSVIMLGRSLSTKRWLSLFLLMVGIAIVQIPPPEAKVVEDATKVSGRSATAPEHPAVSSTVGLTAVIMACVLSGLAGVYFEKILKEAKSDMRATSVWVRNVQLSFYSLWPALFIGVIFKDGEHISQNGFFAGYNYVVWAAILCQAAGGIIVALVVNYADNIAKNFATSISIIISALASVYFFDFHITLFYILGTAVVMGATYLYNSGPNEKKPAPIPIPQEDPDFEKPGDSTYFDMETLGESSRGSTEDDGKVAKIG